MTVLVHHLGAEYSDRFNKGSDSVKGHGRLVALRGTIPRLRARARVKKKVNGGDQDCSWFSVPMVITSFQTKRYTYVWNLQTANQQVLHIHAHLSSHLIRITLSVPMPKAAAPFLREK